MSNVNADATQLLTILKNMRTSISSIETTRSSVKMKYQQLGIGWNDKKYDELGTIVKDCNKALNDILQIMLQAEKYVASLAKSVQEYDNVNLDTPSARNSFLQGLQTPNVGNSSYQYCLGVLTQGSTPDGYIAVISQRHENAEQNVREVFDHFAGKLMIQDSEYPPDQTAHYSPGNYIGHSRGVYYNAASDMTNPRGAGTTYFHELAHMIDHASCNYRSNLSNTPEFAEALVEDGQRILSLYNNLPVEKQTAFLTRITVIQLLIGGGNIFISGCLLLIKISYWIFSAIMGLFAICSRSGVMGIITAVFAGISTALSWLWVKFCMLFLMWSMRQNEYLADEFAYKIGFGLELATVLDQHISDVPHDGFLSAIYSTHPCNDDRVAALQNLGVPYSRY